MRIDGVNKLLRISCQSGNNKYGFYNNSVDPPALVEFPSVPALVEYFKRVPLTEYNPSLDITLFHPLARVSIGINEINIDRPYYHVSRMTLQYTNTKFPPNLLWHFLLTRRMKIAVKNLDIAIYQRYIMLDFLYAAYNIVACFPPPPPPPFLLHSIGVPFLPPQT